MKKFILSIFCAITFVSFATTINSGTMQWGAADPVEVGIDESGNAYSMILGEWVQLSDDEICRLLGITKEADKRTFGLAFSAFKSAHQANARLDSMVPDFHTITTNHDDSTEMSWEGMSLIGAGAAMRLVTSGGNHANDRQIPYIKNGTIGNVLKWSDIATLIAERSDLFQVAGKSDNPKLVFKNQGKSSDGSYLTFAINGSDNSQAIGSRKIDGTQFTTDGDFKLNTVDRNATVKELLTKSDTDGRTYYKIVARYDSGKQEGSTQAFTFIPLGDILNIDTKLDGHSVATNSESSANGEIALYNWLTPDKEYSDRTLAMILTNGVAEQSAAAQNDYVLVRNAAAEGEDATLRYVKIGGIIQQEPVSNSIDGASLSVVTRGQSPNEGKIEVRGFDAAILASSEETEGKSNKYQIPYASAGESGEDDALHWANLGTFMNSATFEVDNESGLINLKIAHYTNVVNEATNTIKKLVVYTNIVIDVTNELYRVGGITNKIVEVDVTTNFLYGISGFTNMFTRVINLSNGFDNHSIWTNGSALVEIKGWESMPNPGPFGEGDETDNLADFLTNKTETVVAKENVRIVTRVAGSDDDPASVGYLEIGDIASLTDSGFSKFVSRQREDYESKTVEDPYIPATEEIEWETETNVTDIILKEDRLIDRKSIKVNDDRLLEVAGFGKAEKLRFPMKVELKGGTNTLAWVYPFDDASISTNELLTVPMDGSKFKAEIKGFKAALADTYPVKQLDDDNNGYVSWKRIIKPDGDATDIDPFRYTSIKTLADYETAGKLQEGAGTNILTLAGFPSAETNTVPVKVKNANNNEYTIEWREFGAMGGATTFIGTDGSRATATNTVTFAAMEDSDVRVSVTNTPTGVIIKFGVYWK